MTLTRVVLGWMAVGHLLVVVAATTIRVLVPAAVVWIGDYGEHLLPLDNDPSLVAARALHDPQNLAAAVYNGKLVALPDKADYGLLYSRMDLITRFNFTGPPRTLDEMEQMMAVIVPEVRKSNPSFMGLTGQVSAYEGLTCNVLEWLGADNAGTILEPNRTLSSFNQSSIIGQRVVNVAKRLQKWNQNGWLQLGLSESASSRLWTQGGTLFHRNWPSVAPATVAANVAWAWRMSPMPGNAAVLGGWLWGISKYTKQPEAAKRVLDLFASSTWQRVRALNGGNVPTIPQLFNDSAVCAALPICAVARDLKIVPRPSSASGTQYLAVSKHIFTRWNDMIRGFGGSIEKQLDAMNRAIADTLSIDILGPPTNVSWDTTVSAAFSAVAALEILTLIVLLGIFWHTREHSSVSVRSVTFIIAGLLSQLVVLFLLVGVPSTPTCLGRFWIHGLGYTLAVSSIAARCFRIWTTSLNPFIERHDSASRIAVLGTMPPLLVTIAILVGLSAAGSLNATDMKMETSRYLTCTASNPSLRPITTIVWYSWLGVQMLAALWVGLKASKLAVGSASQEARTLTVSSANSAFLPVILIPFVDLDLVDQSTGFILRAVAIVIPIAVFIGVYFVPQALQAIHGLKNQASTSTQGLETGLNTFQVTQVDQKKTEADAARPSGDPQIVGTAKVGIAAATSMPALDVKALANQSFKEHVHASEGILSARRSRRAWLAPFMPWTLMRGFILRQEGMLVLQHFSTTVHTHLHAPVLFEFCG
ncbi:hypothetical protein BCR44DRAFT_406739 [Catenaria anguillulae PL171]|uniref:G-protein coupled receptors family 3 profile domain-containing protein n=1 Tax=Catenaria anguillulae PL171 TaxID=765915 RepID=A0A1Y2HSF9_9FUNG|nr:hypothetical protein BCR44DRAFT_406739 [Catenaria anguillulae PL171]